MATRVDAGTFGFVKDLPQLKLGDADSISAPMSETDWDDKVFDDTFGGDILTKTLLSKVSETNAKNASLYFLRCYHGTQDITPKTLFEAIDTILSNMVLDGHTIFTSTEEKDYTFGTFKEEIQEVQFHRRVDTVRLENDTTLTHTQIIADYAKRAQQKTRQEIIETTNYCGFIFLNCLRTAWKQSESTNRHLLNSVRTSYSSIFGAELDHAVAPMSQTFLNFMDGYFSANSLKVRRVLAFLVARWREAKTSKEDNILGFLRAAGLLSLAENGLGGISWPVKAATKLNLELGKYLAYCCYNEAITSQVERCYKFFTKAEKGATWPWCRLLVQSALFNLSTLKNPDLCVVSAWIALDFSEVRMNEVMQFAKLSTTKSHVYPYARAIQNTVRPSVPTVVHTNEAMEMISNLDLSAYKPQTVEKGKTDERKEPTSSSQVQDRSATFTL